MFWFNQNTNGGSENESVRPEDLEFVRRIRGRFTDSAKGPGKAWFLILFFAAGCPFFLGLAFFSDHPVDRLTGLVMAIVYLLLAIFIWRLRPPEYEFTGEEIIQSQRGKPIKRVAISQITKIDVQPRERHLILVAGQTRMVVVMFDPLLEALRQTAENFLSPEEIQQVKQAYAAIEKSRRKVFSVYWLIEVAGVVFTLAVVLAVAMLVIYLGKYFKH